MTLLKWRLAALVLCAASFLLFSVGVALLGSWLGWMALWVSPLPLAFGLLSLQNAQMRMRP